MNPKIHPAYINDVFRNPGSPIKKRINEIIMNPSKNNRTHFALQVTLRIWLGELITLSLI